MDLDPVTASAGTNVVVALVSAVGAYAAGRQNGKAAFITAVHKAAEVVMVQTRDLYDRSEAALRKCEEKHHECEARVNDLAAQVAELRAGALYRRRKVS